MKKTKIHIYFDGIVSVAYLCAIQYSYTNNTKESENPKVSEKSNIEEPINQKKAKNLGRSFKHHHKIRFKK
jgi:hypothetical protein